MSLTDRDRKIVIVLAPLVLMLAYWFLVLSPKREDAAAAGEALTKQEQRLDAAKQASAQLGSARTDFAADYAEMVRLGKALPSTVDMPSLLVQLETAAKGTGLNFTRIATGERDKAAAPAATSQQGSGSGSGSQPPAAAGGQQASSAPGQAAEGANNATSSANASSANNQAAAQSGVDAQTSTASKQGGLPVGGGSAGTSTGDTGSGVAGLDSVPLELEFRGGFFDLADFFHRLKRFVRLANDEIVVQGRLMSVDSLKFTSDPELFPSLKAEIKATVYLAPKTQGATAGATPQGPGTTPASDPAAPAAPNTTTPPTAVAAP